MRRDEIRVLPGGYTLYTHFWLNKRWWGVLHFRSEQVATKSGFDTREQALLWAIEEIERREGLNANVG